MKFDIIIISGYTMPEDIQKEQIYLEFIDQEIKCKIKRTENGDYGLFRTSSDFKKCPGCNKNITKDMQTCGSCLYKRKYQRI